MRRPLALLVLLVAGALWAHEEECKNDQELCEDVCDDVSCAMPDAPGDRLVMYRYTGGSYAILRADGGWVVERIAGRDGGRVKLEDVPVAAPPPQYVNTVTGWMTEVPLRDGGVLRLPASAPAGY